MADATGISYDILSWTQEWYVREDTLRAANLAIIGYHHRLPLTSIFGAGTLSSSDGQRFPTRGKSTTARTMPQFFADQGLSTYTHITDQHTTYGTKVIVTTRREAHYVLDEILGKDSGRLRGPAWRVKSCAVLAFRRGCGADAVGVRVTADPERFAVL